MSDGKKFEQAILAIHETLNKAERQLNRLGRGLGKDLGGRLQFAVGIDGDVEIVRRSERGSPFRPKVVIARLDGTDPLRWRAQYPPWLRALRPRRDVDPQLPKEGNGRPATGGDGEGKNGGSTPPASTGGES